MSHFMKFLAGISFCFSLSVPSSLAGQYDHVKDVFVCGSDVFVRMQNAGWLVAPGSLLSEKTQDRILSIALTLISSGKPSGYFDEGPASNICGITGAKQITVLGINGG